MLNKLYCGVVMLMVAWYGYSQEQKGLTLKMDDASLKEIIEYIEQQTSYSFIYNETIDLSLKKSIDIINQKIENVLTIIFNNTKTEWRIKRNHITLTLKKTETPSVSRATISGYISDNESAESLIGANIYDIISGKGTASNEFGFFSLTVPTGEVALHFSYIGYTPETQKMNLQKDEKLNINLSQNAQLEEVVVTGIKNEESGINATQMSSIDVPLNIFKTTPVLLGETDLMKTIQMLPGVQAGTQGSAGVYVRGGGPDENLILLDGIPLYNVDHLMGFFSIFTPEAVKKVTFFKGSFPARFGGRLSSVIDVRTYDGDMHNYHGTIGIGLLSSKLQFEGPIIKGRTSFNISGRRSYIDLMAKPFINDAKIPPLYFYDLNAKINHKFNDKSRLFISLYNGNDKYGNLSETNLGNVSFRNRENFSWGNTLISARWNYIFSPKLFSNSTIAHTNYRFNIDSEAHNSYWDTDEEYERFIKYNSGIKDMAYKIDFDYYPSSRHHIKFGTGYLYHDFKPEVETMRIKESESGMISDSIYSSQSNSHIYANEVSAYIEDEFMVTQQLSLNAGLNFSLFNVKRSTYTSLQPRLSARYQLKDDIAVKASYTKMNQYINLLSSSNLTLPSDIWVPATERTKPMRSHQYSLGAYYTGINGWELSAETYYKDMRNILEYKDGATYLGSSYNWEDKVEMGRGRSYGIELMAQKMTGKTTGWIAYTLAKSERKFNKTGINLGRWFPYKYDRRHHINVTANHKISEKIDISASWEFYTGGALTVSEETSFIIYHEYSAHPNNTPEDWKGHNPYLNPSVFPANNIKSRNNYRLPASHCLNLGINFRKTKKYGERIWSFGIYNVYNAMNPHFVYRPVINTASLRENERTEKAVLKKMTLFPLIPSFTYTYKF